MLSSFYFFIVPLFLLFLFLVYKFLRNRKAILKNDEENNEGDENLNGKNNLDEAKELVFVFFDNARANFIRNIKVFSHWFLHFFVIFLGLISDLTDILYAKARDFFLKTATSEKKTVSTFWHTLIEYKKESEEEKSEDK